ncbi:MAG: glycosyltransferase family 39 protein [Armatimonadetes bacterium]|nr:glycosyltransferase family 39 protein [Armatimonadota bacterium]
MPKKSAVAAILAIMVLAVVLRVWGISWGLPTERHYFSYHPVETTVLLAALRVNFFQGALDPGFYNYGTLFIYLVNLSVVAGSVFGLINVPSGDIFSKIGEFAKFYLAGRIAALVLGVLTVYLVYLLAKRAYGRGVGILAALFMAVLPIHVMHSKFLAVDVPATFFVVAALIFAVRITDGQRLRDYLLSGLFAGLAAGTKYATGLVIIAPIIAHLSSDKTRPILRPFSPKLIGAILAAALGVLIGTPGAVLNPDGFMRGFTFEMHHARTGHGLVFTDTGSGYVYHLMHSLWPGMGPALLVLSLLGVLYALRRRTAPDLILLAFLVVYYAVIGAAQVRFARYTIPILPVLVILAARVSADLVARLRSGRAFAKSVGYIVILILVLVSGYTLLYSIALDRMCASTDTRDRAADWITRNVPPGSSIGLPTIPWFYTPPLDPYFGDLSARDRYERVREYADYDLVVSETAEWDARFLQRESPQYVVLSEFEYVDRLRTRDQAAREYFDVLRRDYKPVHRFSDAPSIFGVRIPFVGELPHDMSYVSPTILIYERKAG